MFNAFLSHSHKLFAIVIICSFLHAASVAFNAACIMVQSAGA